MLLHRMFIKWKHCRLDRCSINYYYYSDNYGIDVSIDNSENLAEDKLQLLQKGKRI